MKQEDLLAAIGSVSESRLDATEKKKKSLFLRRPFYTLAACLCILLICALAVPSLFGQIHYSADTAGSGFTASNQVASPETATDDQSSSLSFGLLTEGYEVASSEDIANTSSRKLITTMYLVLEVQDYDQVISWVEEQTAACGGYIQSSSSYVDYKDYHHANYTLRIPADDLSAFSAQATAVGNVTSSSTETQNITLTYVDLENQVASLQIEQNRLLALLEEAETLSDILEIEDRLSTVRYQLESYQSTLLLYDNQVTYSTLELSIDQVDAYTESAPVTLGDRIRTGFINNLTMLGENATNLFVFFCSALPTLVVIGVLLGVVILIIKKISKKRDPR